MNSGELVRYLDEYLRIHEIDDSSCNGLQIEGGSTVDRVALAVDFCIESAQEASRLGAQLLLVHHGLIWDGLRSIRGNTYRRIRQMMDSGIGLYAAHLPLDLHPEVGNNAEIARLLGIRPMGTFGKYRGKDLGVWGEFETPVDCAALEKLIAGALKTECRVFPFGKETIQSLGIISGGGGSNVRDAAEKSLDGYLTGESGHSAYYTAKENRLTVITAGHYATETPGLRALGNHLAQKFGIDIQWIDLPTGL